MKKKILFIIWSYSLGGGAESLLTTIVNHLNPEKYDISIIEICHHDVKVEPTNSNIRILPYIMRHDDPNRKHKMYYVYHEPGKVFQKFVNDEYDLYVSFNYQRPIFLLPPRKKCISWIHGDIYDLAAEDKKEELQLEDDALDNVQHIVTISDITMQSVCDLHPRHVGKLVEINNGIDIEQVRKKANEPVNIVLKHPAALFLGRLDANKNPVRAVDIVARVHEIYQIPLHLYLVGVDYLHGAVQARAGELEIEDYVHCLGYYENPFPVVKQCDISILMSKSEGFGMCLLESQVLGKPIVAPNVGVAKLLTSNPNCGATIGTDREAAAVIRRLLLHDTKKIHDACIESAQRFALDKYIEKIECLFDETMGE